MEVNPFIYHTLASYTTLSAAFNVINYSWCLAICYMSMEYFIQVGESDNILELTELYMAHNKCIIIAMHNIS